MALLTFKGGIHPDDGKNLAKDKAIVEVACREGLACWDLFASTGGKNSSARWRKTGLMGRDRVHFTKEGYQEQGILLYRALMQTYNRYIADNDVR